MTKSEMNMLYPHLDKSKDLSIKSKHIFIQFNRDKEILLPLMPYLIQKQQQKQKQDQE